MATPLAATVVVASASSADRSWLRRILEASGEYLVVDEATDGVQAIDQVVRHLPDALVIDLPIAPLSGVEVIPSVRSRSPGTAVVLLAEPSMEAALRVGRWLGAMGSITRQESAERIRSTVRAACSVSAATAPAALTASAAVQGTPGLR